MEYLDKNDIFTLYWPPQSSGVARGGRWGRSAPGGKIEDITKNLEREKILKGRNFRKGLQKSRRWSEK